MRAAARYGANPRQSPPTDRPPPSLRAAGDAVAARFARAACRRPPSRQRSRHARRRPIRRKPAPVPTDGPASSFPPRHRRCRGRALRAHGLPPPAIAPAFPSRAPPPDTAQTHASPHRRTDLLLPSAPLVRGAVAARFARTACHRPPSRQRSRHARRRPTRRKPTPVPTDGPTSSFPPHRSSVAPWPRASRARPTTARHRTSVPVTRAAARYGANPRQSPPTDRPPPSFRAAGDAVAARFARAACHRPPSRQRSRHARRRPTRRKPTPVPTDGPTSSFPPHRSSVAPWPRASHARHVHRLDAADETPAARPSGFAKMRSARGAAVRSANREGTAEVQRTLARREASAIRSGRGP